MADGLDGDRKSVQLDPRGSESIPGVPRPHFAKHPASVHPFLQKILQLDDDESTNGPHYPTTPETLSQNTGKKTGRFPTGNVPPTPPVDLLITTSFFLRGSWVHRKKFLIGICVVTRCNTLPAPHHVAPPPQQNHIKSSLLYNDIASDNTRITFLSGVLPAEVVGNVIVGSLIRRHLLLLLLPPSSPPFQPRNLNVHLPSSVEMYECSGCGKKASNTSVAQPTPEGLCRPQVPPQSRGAQVLKGTGYTQATPKPSSYV